MATYDEQVNWHYQLRDYARYVVVPRLLAEGRRKKGDPTAGPRDYLCDCPIDPDELLPHCHETRPTCRFRHRLVTGLRIGNNPVVHAMTKTETARLWRLCANPATSRDLRLRVLAHWDRTLARRARDEEARRARKKAADEGGREPT